MSPIEKFMESNGLRNFETKGRKLTLHPSGPRAIDQEAGYRTKAFKVIVASVSRSGTLSMYAALQDLGMQPYHMAEAIKDAKRDLNIACEALEANCLGEGQPFGRDEFDRWIGDYDATSDMPMTQLSLDLFKAYPDAKVILSTRHPDSWHHSMETTVLPVLRWRIWGILPFISKDASAFQRLINVSRRVTDNWSRDYYMAHNDRIKKLIPKNQLLEFRLGKDGYPELCEFLEIPVPENKSYPYINEGGGNGKGMFYSVHVVLINYWLLTGLVDKSRWLMPLTVMAGAWYASRTGILDHSINWIRSMW